MLSGGNSASYFGLKHILASKPEIFDTWFVMAEFSTPWKLLIQASRRNPPCEFSPQRTIVTLYPYYTSARSANNCFPLNSWGVFHTNHDGGIILQNKLICSSPGFFELVWGFLFFWVFKVKFRPETAKQHERSKFVISQRMGKDECNEIII